jgi:hypothetical protein
MIKCYKEYAAIAEKTLYFEDLTPLIGVKFTAEHADILKTTEIALRDNCMEVLDVTGCSKEELQALLEGDETAAAIFEMLTFRKADYWDVDSLIQNLLTLYDDLATVAAVIGRLMGDIVIPVRATLLNCTELLLAALSGFAGIKPADIKAEIHFTEYDPDAMVDWLLGRTEFVDNTTAAEEEFLEDLEQEAYAEAYEKTQIMVLIAPTECPVCGTFTDMNLDECVVDKDFDETGTFIAAIESGPDEFDCSGCGAMYGVRGEIHTDADCTYVERKLESFL